MKHIRRPGYIAQSNPCYAKGTPMYYLGIILIGILVSFLFPISANARVAHNMPIAQQEKQADLIAIGSPISTKETSEVFTFPYAKAIIFDPKTKTKVISDVTGSGIETTFQALAVLKGPPQIETFVFHYYRQHYDSQISSRTSEVHEINGSNSVSFDTTKGDCYLMFLKKDADGNYVAVAGQTDPGNSIRRIAHTNDLRTLWRQWKGEAKFPLHNFQSCRRARQEERQ